ncbi:MAG TPA: GAF domain-containing sensor histidine kinase [Anaerolineales bacterium]|nr:GAF domain-containing sensor histidine kinase [Anaerolineales bacterium]
MTITNLFSISISSLSIIGYLLMLVYLALREISPGTKRMLMVFLAWSIVLSTLHIFATAGWNFRVLPLGVILGCAYLVSAGIFGILTGIFAGFKQGLWLWIPIAVFLALLLITFSSLRMFADSRMLAMREIFVSDNPQIAIVFIVLWLLLYAGMILTISFTISRLNLPLHINRQLWWLVILPCLAITESLSIFAPAPLDTLGFLARWLVLVAVIYAIRYTQLLDIRNLIRVGFGNSVMIAITAGIILMGVGVGLQVLADPSLPGARGLWVLVIFSVVLALIFQVLRGVVAGLIEQLVLRFSYDPAQVAANYAKKIPNLLEYNELSVAAATTLRDSIEARGGLLLLLTSGENGTFAEVIPGIGKINTTPTEFSQGTPFLTLPGRTKNPITQYEIEIDPSYRDIPKNERDWLTTLGMDVFVPIFDNGKLIGMLGVGPRLSGEPYRKRELDLMSAVADQTSVALKNARLFAQQKHLVDEMQSLNEELLGSNRRLEEMDQVKTDFLTIASHELRTPLTQVRGFTDVLDTLNEAGMLDSKQIGEITQSLLRACDRLDSVIGQMLDVSQIDVDAMQLKFVETTLETVVRMAVEPYATAIMERKQKLTVRGVSQMPSMMLDLQRSVQAFGQILSNAIKYTPDNGKIEISAEKMPITANEPESILIKFKDTGVGIDPKYHDLIFEKFFRIGSTALHSTSTTKFMGAGPGLGLPIAKGVIKGHGGRIWVESLGFDRDACPGTTVFIVLPVRPPRITSGSRFSLEVDELEKFNAQ